jgi:hypothetical protein
VFGINVRRFVTSPLYADFVQKHGPQIAGDLAEITAKTGVNPNTDIDYVFGAGRQGQAKSAGVVIAVGRFDQNTITNFINSKVTPIRLEYGGAVVLMMPENNKMDKGVAFLSAEEIAVGDLESLHAVLDVRSSGKPGVMTNPSLKGMLDKVHPDNDMFWFAGDATVLSKLPANTPMMPTLNTIQRVYGAINLGVSISGKVSITASDDKAATQLADFARGLVALGNLASAQNPELAELVRGIQVAQNTAITNQLDISITLPIDILQKLEAAKAAHITK